MKPDGLSQIELEGPLVLHGYPYVKLKKATVVLWGDATLDLADYLAETYGRWASDQIGMNCGFGTPGFLVVLEMCNYSVFDIVGLTVAISFQCGGEERVVHFTTHESEWEEKAFDPRDSEFTIGHVFNGADIRNAESYSVGLEKLFPKVAFNPNYHERLSLIEGPCRFNNARGDFKKMKDQIAAIKRNTTREPTYTIGNENISVSFYEWGDRIRHLDVGVSPDSWKEYPELVQLFHPFEKYDEIIDKLEDVPQHPYDFHDFINSRDRRSARHKQTHIPLSFDTTFFRRMYIARDYRITDVLFDAEGDASLAVSIGARNVLADDQLGVRDVRRTFVAKMFRPFREISALSYKYNPAIYESFLGHSYFPTSIFRMYRRPRPNLVKNFTLFNERALYAYITTHLADEYGFESPKAVHEYKLYWYLRSIYPDAVYQYTASWLGLQSLDVYIPSLNVAFEYQGKQHYEPVEFFGGKENFEYTVRLDEAKEKKSRDMGVTIYYWPYDFDVTLENVISVLRELGVDGAPSLEVAENSIRELLVGKKCSELLTPIRDRVRRKAPVRHRPKKDAHPTRNAEQTISNGKPGTVYQIDPSTGEVVGEYESISSAAKSLGVTSQGISAVLNGRTSSAYGYLWARADKSHRAAAKEVQPIDPPSGQVLATFPSIGAAARATGLNANSISRALDMPNRRAGNFAWRSNSG